MPHIIKKLSRLEKRHRRINIGKTAALFVILGFMVKHFVAAGQLSPIAITGFGWIISTTIAFVFYYWRVQFQLEALDLQSESRTFLQRAIGQLNRQIRLFGWLFRLFVLALLLGVNALGAGFWANANRTSIIRSHTVASTIIMAAFYGGLKIRHLRFRRELYPLIDEMNEILSDLPKKQNAISTSTANETRHPHPARFSHLL